MRSSLPPGGNNDIVYVEFSVITREKREKEGEEGERGKRREEEGLGVLYYMCKLLHFQYVLCVVGSMCVQHYMCFV